MVYAYRIPKHSLKTCKQKRKKKCRQFFSDFAADYPPNAEQYWIFVIDRLSVFADRFPGTSCSISGPPAAAWKRETKYSAVNDFDLAVTRKDLYALWVHQRPSPRDTTHLPLPPKNTPRLQVHVQTRRHCTHRIRCRKCNRIFIIISSVRTYTI